MKYVHLTNNIVDFEMEAHPSNVFGSPYVDEFVECHDMAVTNGWTYNGVNFIKPTVPPKTVNEIKQEITDATSRRLDDFARTRNYDGILSLCTYATSTNPTFAKEGQYGVNMRDATWAKLYEILAEVEAGIRPAPTGYVDIEAELPLLDWSSIV